MEKTKNKNCRRKKTYKHKKHEKQKERKQKKYMLFIKKWEKRRTRGNKIRQQIITPHRLEGGGSC